MSLSSSLSSPSLRCVRCVVATAFQSTKIFRARHPLLGPSVLACDQHRLQRKKASRTHASLLSLGSHMTRLHSTASIPRLGLQHRPTDDDRRPPSAANEADDHEGLAHSQQPLSMKLVPPHRHGSPLPNPSSQPSPDGAKQSSCPEQFPLGSTGAGNRNLRELELSEAYHVHHGLSREGAKPTVAGNGVGPTGGDEQAAVEPTTSESLSPRNRTGTAQPAGAFDGVSGRDPPEDTTAATARLVYISERSQGWSGGPENVQQAGGVDGNEEALSGGDARTDRGGGGEARLEVDCLPQVSSRNDTATDVMDEEEMVVKAIKNFRLLPHESNTHTPRWRGAAEKATPFRGPRTTADRHNATWAGEENEACRGRDKGAESAALRSQEGVQRGKNISPRPSARQACGLAEAGEGHSARGRRSSGRKYFCEGSDWILQVNPQCVVDSPRI